MNEGAIEILVHEIMQHYRELGNYIYLPGHEECSGHPHIKLLGANPHPGESGFYKGSLTIESNVISSSSGQSLLLNPLPIKGLYWIMRSQGYDNARIIAHVCSWGQSEHRLFAFVGK